MSFCAFFFFNLHLHFEVHFVKKKYTSWRNYLNVFLSLFLENLIFK